MDDFGNYFRRCLMFICLCLSIQSAYAAREGYLSKDDTEIERQLKILNKPPIKTMVKHGGDIIDCIDIHSQPAFDNPLLKNHKIEMAPNFTQEEKSGEIASSTESGAPWLGIELEREICPPGTVPIRRTKKRDLKNGSKYFSENTKLNGPPDNRLTPMYRHFVSLEPTEGKKYYGGYARIGLHNPSVNRDQFSTAQMWVQNGPEKAINSIAVGWAVYPELFGDNVTRLFSYWTADGYKRTGCFNMLCPGFVQVHPSITFGELIGPISVYGGKKYSVLARVYRAPETGNWWLSFEKEVIGYWPKELFSHLANDASAVRYGAVAGAVPGRPFPQMGNGLFPTEGYDLETSGYIREMKVFNEELEAVYFDFGKTMKKQDTRGDCYKLDYYWHASEEETWNFVKFGGPGGSRCP